MSFVPRPRERFVDGDDGQRTARGRHVRCLAGGAAVSRTESDNFIGQLSDLLS